MQEEKKEKSKLFLLVVFGLLGYASWYFFTQFDQKQLMEMLPFSEEKNSINEHNR
jgi:cytoskeletal protein RodZ